MKRRIKSCVGALLAIMMLAMMAVPAMAASMVETTELDHNIFVNGGLAAQDRDNGFDLIACRAGSGDVTGIKLNGRDVPVSVIADSRDAAEWVAVTEGGNDGVVSFYKENGAVRVHAANLKQNVTILFTTGATSTDPEPAEKADIVIDDGAQSGTYFAWRILNLTTSLKSDCGHGEDGEHTSSCYNYSYTVNAAYESAIRAGLKAAGVENVDGLNGAALISAINGLGDKSEKIQTFANAAYAAISGANIPADRTSSNSAFNNVDQGYYLIAETGDVQGANESKSLVMLDTAGQTEVVVTTKEALPTLTKKVIENGVAQDAADAGIGDHVEFVLTGTLPKDLGSYATYKFVFHDTMAAGLSLDADSFAVTVGADKTPVDSSKYQVVTEGLSDGCTFEVVFDDIKTIEGASASGTVSVRYTATLTEDAVMGAEGNQNKAALEFSNDPYGTGTGKTPEDIVTVFSYVLNVDKVDPDNKPLSGAAFELQKSVDNDWVPMGREFVVTDGAKFVMRGLDSGKYKLVETQVPDGFNKADDVVFEIVGTYETEGDLCQLTALTVKDAEGNVISGADADFTVSLSTGTVSTAIVNNSGVHLPTTGGPGLIALYVIGGLAVACGLVVFVISSKRKAAK